MITTSVSHWQPSPADTSSSTPSHSVSPVSSSSSPPHSKTLAIVGGVIGAICFLLLIIFGYVAWRRLSRRHRNEDHVVSGAHHSNLSGYPGSDPPDHVRLSRRCPSVRLVACRRPSSTDTRIHTDADTGASTGCFSGHYSRWQHVSVWPRTCSSKHKEETDLHATAQRVRRVRVQPCTPPRAAA